MSYIGLVTTEEPAAMPTPEPAAAVTYRRVPHAAHYGAANTGHDLEQWDVAQPFAAPHPDAVPADAEKHSGYIARDGKAHTLFVRRAPLTGTCPRCERVAS